MAAAAADFPGFPKPYTAANLETKPSGGQGLARNNLLSFAIYKVN